MALKSAEEVFREVKEKYSRNPRGWRVYLDLKRDYPTLLIVSPEKAWMVKFESIYRSNPPGIGAEVSLPKRKLPGRFSFGLRPLDKNIIKMILSSKRPEDLIVKAFKREPVAPHDLKSSGVLIGPYYRSSLSFLSSRQREIEKKLDRELERLLNRRYPSVI